ncbi:MAG: hypothetical protein IPL81_10545 [Flavobacteriales bacterium]|nr:hypothetical protein [Flavobacteriales bacterium]
MKNTAFTLIALFATPTFCHAQKLVESRDQASGWYVPVKLQVTAEGTKAKNLAVQVYQDNELLQEIHSKKASSPSIWILTTPTPSCSTKRVIDQNQSSSTRMFRSNRCSIRSTLAT